MNVQHAHREDHLQWLLGELDRLAQLEPGWDSYDAPTPSAKAVDGARLLLGRLHQVNHLPEKAMPSVEGGIGFNFRKNDRVAYIECDNDGEIFLTTYAKEGPVRVWPVPTAPRDIDEGIE